MIVVERDEDLAERFQYILSYYRAVRIVELVG